MRRVRCFIDAPLVANGIVALPADARAHLTKVLRLRDGDAVTLFNGDGHDYPARLVGAGAGISAQVLAREAAAAAEAQLSITLVQALARGEKMDWIIQKAVELGVTRIVPVTTQRSEVKLDAERAEKRLVHWRGVIESACEQCGRARVPAIDAPTPLHAVVAMVDAPLRVVLHPEGDARLADLSRPDTTSAAIAIGPEGGFDDPEIAAFTRAGWRRLRLGARVLRTETAGVAAVAALLAVTGEF